jgi:hypothetical protein
MVMKGRIMFLILLVHSSFKGIKEYRHILEDDIQKSLLHTPAKMTMNTRYGMAFLNPGKVKSGRLKYSESEKLKVNLAFDGNPIKVGEKFLVILVPVSLLMLILFPT